MFCTKCGSKVPESNNYCNNCGHLVTRQVKNAVPQQSYDTGDRPFMQMGVLFYRKSKPHIRYFVNMLIRHKWLLGGLATVFIAAIVVYKLFFEPKPDADAKVILLEQCQCQKSYNAELLAVLKNFSKDFNPAKYKSRNEAYIELNSSKEVVGDELNKCMDKTYTHQREVRNRYITQAKKLGVFDNIVNNGWLNLCPATTEAAISSLQIEIENKIISIIEAEPAVDVVKEKLIGQILPGWKIESLSEFQLFEITNKINTGSRIEYTANINFISNDGKSSYNYTNALIVFTLGSDGVWYFNSITIPEMKWSFNVVNQWYKVQIPIGYAYNIDTHGNKAWAKDDSWFAHNYKIGGTDGESISFHSNSIQIASREPQQITITLNFTRN